MNIFFALNGSKLFIIICCKAFNFLLILVRPSLRVQVQVNKKACDCLLPVLMSVSLTFHLMHAHNILVQCRLLNDHLFEEKTAHSTDRMFSS